MLKKEVKGKTSKPSTGTTKRRKKNIRVKGLGILVFLLVMAAILFACYQFLGFKLTLVVALLLFVLAAICSLILRVKNKIRRKKIISLFMIFFLTLGIIALSCFCAASVHFSQRKEVNPRS